MATPARQAHRPTTRQTELADRAPADAVNAGGTPPRDTGTALAAVDALTGTSSRADVVDTKLREATRFDCHLIAPATRCDVLPPGCGVSIQALTIDAATETYPVKGSTKRGLSKSALQRLGGLLGLSWDPVASRRLDDRKDPHYVEWLAVGYYRSFDGQVVTVTATKELDLRDGSPQIATLTDNQLREMRSHIASHAETKAQLRAIRSLGIRTGYEPAELQKPFVCARILWTGETADPELRRVFAERTADAMLGSSALLFGGRPAGTPESTPRMSLPAHVPTAPPSGVAGDAEGEDYDPRTGEVREALPAQTTAKPAATPPKAELPAPKLSGVTVRGPGGVDVAIEKAETKLLARAAERIEQDLADGAFPAEEVDGWRADLAAIQGEIERRVNAGG